MSKEEGWALPPSCVVTGNLLNLPAKVSAGTSCSKSLTEKNVWKYFLQTCGEGNGTNKEQQRG